MREEFVLDIVASDGDENCNVGIGYVAGKPVSFRLFGPTWRVGQVREVNAGLFTDCGGAAYEYRDGKWELARCVYEDAVGDTVELPAPDAPRVRFARVRKNDEDV